MKKYLTLVIIIVGLLSCKKSGVKVSPDLFGKWELRRFYGGRFSNLDSVYKPGNGNVYRFNADSTYKRYDNNGLVAQGKFHIRRGNVYQLQSANTILFDNDNDGEPVAVNGTKLTIGTTVADGPAYEYLKISN